MPAVIIDMHRGRATVGLDSGADAPVVTAADVSVGQQFLDFGRDEVCKGLVVSVCYDDAAGLVNDGLADGLGHNLGEFALTTDVEFDWD